MLKDEMWTRRQITAEIKIIQRNHSIGRNMNEIEQKNKYTKNQRRKMDNHRKKMEQSMQIDEFTCQTAKGSRKEYCKKTMN